MIFVMTFSSKKEFAQVIITCKWSLGEGNVFTHVCHSVHRGGSAFKGGLHWGGWADPTGLPTGGSASRGVNQTPTRDTWDTMGYGQQAGGTHPTGMHSCSECDCIFKSNYWRSQSHNLNSYHWHPYNTFHAIWENPVAPKKNLNVWMGPKKIRKK